MARLTGFAAALALSVAAGAAFAQSGVLSAREARGELFGVHMVGVIEGTPTRWSECIAPAGDTVYRVEDVRDDIGRLEISPEGHACFSYASSGYRSRACWVVRRAGGNYRFESTGGSDTVFVTRSVTRGVRRCDGGDAPVA